MITLVGCEHSLNQFQGDWPLIFTKVELYDASQWGNEVFVGRGAIALLDPSPSNIVGNYQLFFFSADDPSTPTISMSIGPGTRLYQLNIQDEEDEQQSFMYGLISPGVPSRSLRFDESEDAEGFARDFQVRQRLMQFTLTRGQHQKDARGLKKELAKLQNRGLFALLRKLLIWSAYFLISALLLHVVYSKATTPELSAANALSNSIHHATVIASTFCHVVGWFFKAFCEVGCRRSSSRILLTDIEQCMSTPVYHSAESCLERLVGRMGVHVDTLQAWDTTFSQNWKWGDN